MLCLYSYRIGDKEFGRYQSEVEDFKKLFKKLVRKLDDVVVELKNGDVWIFYKINKLNVGIWEKIKGNDKNCIKKVMVNLQVINMKIEIEELLKLRKFILDVENDEIELQYWKGIYLIEIGLNNVKLDGYFKIEN